MDRARPEYRCFAASITVFDQGGNFDPDGQRRHFRRLADAGVSAVVGSSGAGEGYTLSAAEWHELLRIGREELKDNNQQAARVRFDLMGMESRSAAQMIDLYHLAREHDIDGIHIYGLEMGHGSRPDAREAERYLRDVLSEVDIPSYLCNQPQMIGYDLPPTLVARLIGEYPHIVGVLDTSRDVRYLADIRQLCGDGIELVTTLDSAMSLLTIGGHAVACGEANIAPRLCASFVSSFAAGDYEQCFADYRMLIDLNRVIARTIPVSSQVHSYKAILQSLGLPGGGAMRPPRQWIASDDQRILADRITELGIPELEGLTVHG